ncbi:MAG: prefoldin subunit alpha [Candidatus Hydrothermarchaeales archaeon]
MTMAEDLRTLEEFELFKAQIEALKQNLELIDISINELQKVSEGLGVIGSTKDGSEILVPMGADSFINAKVTDTQNVIIGLGAGVATKKSIAEAKSDIEKRIKGLEEIRNDTKEKLQTALKKFDELTPRVQEIISKIQKEG